MRLISLQSGSNGNCIFVEAAGVRLLFDAGITGRKAEERLSPFGYDIRACDALIISHNHADHTQGLGVFQRKFKLPVHVTEKTLVAAQRYRKLGRLDRIANFQSGDTLDFGRVKVETIPTPHDGVDGVAFVVDDGSARLGILTDLGHAYNGLRELLPTLDAVFIESNHDHHMLRHGPYPYFLKKRIAGPKGHISNQEAAELLHDHANGRMKWVCLGHLSSENNEPEIAFATHKDVLGNRYDIHIASRHGAAGPLEV